jgi:hypothetical protein
MTSVEELLPCLQEPMTYGCHGIFCSIPAVRNLGFCQVNFVAVGSQGTGCSGLGLDAGCHPLCRIQGRGPATGGNLKIEIARGVPFRGQGGAFRTNRLHSSQTLARLSCRGRNPCPTLCSGPSPVVKGAARSVEHHAMSTSLFYETCWGAVHVSDAAPRSYRSTAVDTTCADRFAGALSVAVHVTARHDEA